MVDDIAMQVARLASLVRERPGDERLATKLAMIATLLDDVDELNPQQVSPSAA